MRLSLQERGCCTKWGFSLDEFMVSDFCGSVLYPTAFIVGGKPGSYLFASFSSCFFFILPLFHSSTIHT